eukprot:CAMPEP_0174254662 /NCGR_PEP_ID=MMETSP0439-20130205/3985_1 /TAXON_ID=0 /ORGANISM="Stereomyxa ramosa, Strain Chinc5" /LENGTH=440 /DNA_ID=CAMNT_0015336383 /DNA_START=81 /DNA_END=1403 /DNA_ORIENTATION=+
MSGRTRSRSSHHHSSSSSKKRKKSVDSENPTSGSYKSSSPSNPAPRKKSRRSDGSSKTARQSGSSDSVHPRDPVVLSEDHPSPLLETAPSTDFSEKGRNIAMNLLQEFQFDLSDDTLSVDALTKVEEVMQHTLNMLVFVKRYAPTPSPPTLGMFCIFSAEISHHLFSFLEAKDLLVVRCVCKEFSRRSKDQFLWKLLCKRHFSPIRNTLHIQSGKNWEWLYRCKATVFQTKAEIKNGDIGTFRSKKTGAMWEGEWEVKKPETPKTSSFFTMNRSSQKTSMPPPCFLRGYGLYISSNNHIYEGFFKDGSLNDTGRDYSTIEEFEYEYVGGFSEGIWSGQGTCVYADGRKYEGNWQRQQHGMGTMSYSDGRIYEGQWKNGTREGKGTMTWKTGEKCIGTWKQGDLKHVEKFILKDNTLIEAPNVEEVLTSLFLILNNPTKRQ